MLEIECDVLNFLNSDGIEDYYGEFLKGINIDESIPKSWKNILSSYFPSMAGIFEEVEYLNSKTNRFKHLEEIIMQLISNIANKNKLIIILEDIHWMVLQVFQF